MEARIIRSARREFNCKNTENGEVIVATALGKQLKGGSIVVGDFVELENQNGNWVITEVKERKNSIYRRIIRERTTKTIASNIDIFGIICAVSKPSFKRGLIDRYLLRSIQWEMPALVVFNKMDQFDNQFDIEFERKRLSNIGVKTLLVSAMDLKLFDGPEFINLLKKNTSIFVGQSGVGKSHLITSISDGKIQLRSEKLAAVGKGSHTTTWAELIYHKDIAIVDSPGTRTLSIQDISLEEFENLWPDLNEFFSHCKFNDCKHEDFSKGCSFNEIKNENSDFILSRLESYKRFKSELEQIPEWEKN